LVKTYSDEKLTRMRRGGHDPEKVYAAYRAAELHKGQPTVILAKTVKGYGLGSAGEGNMKAHNTKEMAEDHLVEFRTRFGLPISDEDAAKATYYKPSEDSAEMQYIKERREALGGPVPSRPTEAPKMEVPTFDGDYRKRIDRDSESKPISTTKGAVRLLTRLCDDKQIGKNIVPIVPDESRTFGMEGMFKKVGIYAHAGQLYEPADSDGMAPYRESQDGQLLEEGISEAGAQSSFNAAGTAYSAHGINMIPFYIYYSMFGFQRVGDLIWAASDMRAKGFLLGGTAGRTSLNGEGLQHQDGHSLMNVMVGNDDYVMPKMPEGCEEGIIKGMYKFRSVEADKPRHRVQLFGSGAIMQGVLKAQELLAEKYGISSDVWSVTSYNELRRDAQACKRWNMFHPTMPKRKGYLETVMEGAEGPVIAASDYVQALAEQVAPFIKEDFRALGTDGVGRSETRPALRRHFEV